MKTFGLFLFDDYKSLTIKMLLFLFIVIIVAKFDFYRVKECRLQVHTTGSSYY